MPLDNANLISDFDVVFPQLLSLYMGKLATAAAVYSTTITLIDNFHVTGNHKQAPSANQFTRSSLVHPMKSPAQQSDAFSDSSLGLKNETFETLFRNATAPESSNSTKSGSSNSVRSGSSNSVRSGSSSSGQTYELRSQNNPSVSSDGGETVTSSVYSDKSITLQNDAGQNIRYTSAELRDKVTSDLINETMQQLGNVIYEMSPNATPGILRNHINKLFIANLKDVYIANTSLSKDAVDKYFDEQKKKVRADVNNRSSLSFNTGAQRNKIINQEFLAVVFSDIQKKEIDDRINAIRSNY